MTIQERKKPIEFIYVHDLGKSYMGDACIEFNILYDPEQIKEDDINTFPLKITRGGQKLDCPVELLQEVIQFLIKKGVINDKVVPSGGFVSPSGTGSPLPIPTIINSVEKDHISSVSEPFTSFNDFSTSEVVDSSVEVVNSLEEINNSKENKNKKIEEPKEIPPEALKRPVFRNRITGENPLQAEQEASEMRGRNKGNFRRKENGI